MNTLGIYVQIPFCGSKCSFCNFSSQVARDDVISRYCQALEREMEQRDKLATSAGIASPVLHLPVDTIYFGGGTPTMLGDARLGSIVAKLGKACMIESSCEFTMEVTPASVDEGFLKALRIWGVNRLSIGAQSFCDAELRAVGRLHSAADTHATVARARGVGFDNISLDLIAGLPGQTESSWRESLDALNFLRPEHVSVYIFEVDEKSRLGREVVRYGNRYGALEMPDEDFMASAYEYARDFLRGSGYAQYEISNFALPGSESRHNRKYWRLDPYVGLGAGAHSFDGERRWANEVSPEGYARRIAQGESPVVELRTLRAQEAIEEFFFLGLRQKEGVDLARARARWGSPALSRWESIIADLTERNLIVCEDGRIRLSEHAMLLSNEVFQEFLVTEMEA